MAIAFFIAVNRRRGNKGKSQHCHNSSHGVAVLVCRGHECNPTTKEVADGPSERDPDGDMRPVRRGVGDPGAGRNLGANDADAALSDKQLP